MECLSQYLIILVMFCIAEAYQMTNFSSQPTKVAKNKNEDITLRCSLLDRHERFNRNASVTWWFKKNCKVPCWHQPDEDEWTEIDCGGACRLSFDLDDSTASNGFYLCKMFPYRIGDQTALQIEVTKTFEVTIIDPMMAPPPELLHDTPNDFTLPLNSQLVLQCKCKSSQKPTIKWFKKKDENYPTSEEHTYESYSTFMESSRSIKYFENFYEPIVSSGVKELVDNIYLSKLIVNNITHNSVYVCVVINYFGFSYRETIINVQTDEPLEAEEEFVFDPPEKHYEALFLIPVLLLMPSTVLLCTLFYLLINRQIMRSNKGAQEIV